MTSQNLKSTAKTDPARLSELSERELELIRSAYGTVAEGGSIRTSLREIANEAGVSKALLLYHFGSKDALLLASMQWAVERTERRIRESLAGSADIPDRITALIDAIFVGPEANRRFYTFYLDLVEHVARVPGFGGLSTMLDEIINGLYAEVIQSGLDDQTYVVEDKDRTARAMRALIEGMFVQWLQTPDWRENHGRWKEECRQSLLRLVGAN